MESSHVPSIVRDIPDYPLTNLEKILILTQVYRKGFAMKPSVRSFLTRLITLVVAESGVLSFAAGQRLVSLPPSLQLEARWLMNARNPRPHALKTFFAMPPHRAVKGEPIGDSRTELEFYKRSYPNGVPSPDELVKAHTRARSVSDDLHAPRLRTVSTPPSRWTPRGPDAFEWRNTTSWFTGRVSCLGYDSYDGLYMGAAQGGLWRPGSWFYDALTDTLPTLSSGAVAIVPNNSNIIFYGTGEYINRWPGSGTGVYRSINHGSTWQHLDDIVPTPGSVSRIAIAPWNPSLVLIATLNGLYRSTNGTAIHCTFDRVIVHEVSDITISSTVMYAGLPGYGVWRSLDGGGVWERVTLPLPLPAYYVGRVSVALAPSNPNRAYIAITQGDSICMTILRSDNAAADVPTWTPIMPTSDIRYYMWHQGNYNNTIVVHPTNPDLAFFGGGSILRTTDAGSSWTEILCPHADIHAMLYRPGSNELFVANDGGVMTTLDNGNTWSCALNTMLPLAMFYNIDVCRSNDDVIFGAAQDNAVIGTAPGQRDRWKTYNTGDGIDVAVDWSNSSTVYTTDDNGYLKKTTSGGADGFPPGWPTINLSLEKGGWDSHVVQDPLDPSWIYINGTWRIYYSSNGGSDWHECANASQLPDPVKTIRLNSDGTMLYVVTHGACKGFHKTAGPTFTNVIYYDSLPRGGPENIATSMTDPQRAYLLYNGGASGKVYLTTNAGNHWTNITGNYSSPAAVRALVESPYNTNVLWLATDLGVYKTLDGGAHWWWWNIGMPDAVEVNDLQYVQSPDGDYIVAGTFGRSTFIRNVNATIYTSSMIRDAMTSLGHWRSVLTASSPGGVVVHSTNLGSTWDTSWVSGQNALNRIYMFDSLNFIVIGAAGTISRTTDGGKGWGVVNNPASTDLHDITFQTNDRGFIAGDGTLMATTDGGKSWNDFLQSASLRMNSIRFADSLHGFACGTDAGGTQNLRVLYFTTDGGSSWMLYSKPLGSGSMNSLSFPDPRHGYCATDNGEVLATGDGGLTWSVKKTGIVTPLYACAFADSLSGWVCGSSGIVLRTVDGGATWDEDETETTGDLFDISLVYDQLFIAGTTGILSHEVERPMQLQYAMDARWNLISLPLAMNVTTVSTVFPDAKTSAFRFNGTYEPESELSNGIGYWLKFDTAHTVNVQGRQITSQAIDLVAGWNMIGSISFPVPAESLRTDPDGIITSSLFDYENGYHMQSVLEPGRGYWVKTSQAGQLMLRTNPIALPDTAYIPIDSVWPGLPPKAVRRLTITDARGNSQELLFSCELVDDALLHRYDLPPAPPEGVFDVRYASSRLLDAIHPDNNRGTGIQISNAQYPVTIEWDQGQSDGFAALDIAGKRTVLSGKGNIVLQLPGTPIALMIGRRIVQPLPSAYRLAQNYPNPFNPSSIIEYDLPRPGYVSLKVFNVLGQEVATLVDGMEDAGYRVVRFDARDFPSGVYLYHLHAGTFDAGRKMLIVK